MDKFEGLNESVRLPLLPVRPVAVVLVIRSPGAVAASRLEVTVVYVTLEVTDVVVDADVVAAAVVADVVDDKAVAEEEVNDAGTIFLLCRSDRSCISSSLRIRSSSFNELISAFIFSGSCG